MKNYIVRVINAAILVCGSLPAAAGEIEFARDIQPILAEKCLLCHGPDESKREAELRLDDRASALAEHDSGFSIVPGKPDESELIRRILSDDSDEVMPPPDHKKPVTKKELTLLRQWIAEGAPYQTHWAFVPPVRSMVPADGHLVDTFVRARLKREKLSHAPEADRAVLLRRLSLDLIGLPPTIKELDAFLSDTSSDAYDKQVERLLASPHYGERWARWWLDAARYADSDGYEKDLPRQQWPWRDWVINALNHDMPYDRFIIEQFAGDLLPDATQDQRVATGFLRNSMVNEEGAIIAEEFRTEGVIDRMDCIGRAVLGLTLSCGQCHDHKYDPISQREYYGLFAFLNNTYESVQHVYSPSQQQSIQEIEKNVHEKEAELKKKFPEWKSKLDAWIAAEAAKLKKESWTTLHPSSAEVPDGICHPEILADGTVLNLGFRPTYTILTTLAETQETNLTGLRFEALTHGDLIFRGPGRNHRGSFAISEMTVEIAPLSKPEAFERIKVVSATSDVAIKEGLIDEFFRRNKDDRRIVGGGQFLIDGSQRTGWSPDRGPRWRNEASHAVLRFEKPVGHKDGSRIRVKMNFRHGGRDGHGRKNNFIGRYRLDVTSDKEPKAAPWPAEVRRALAKSSDQRTDGDQRILLRQWARSEKDANALVQSIDDHWAKWPEGGSVLNLAPRIAEHRRKTFVLDRGSWQKPTKEVQPSVPASLHPLPPTKNPTRLDFARWLVDPRSPTTARVIVNRMWQEYFGTGLVVTPEDLGVRAEAPSHPQLLDTLSVELMKPTIKTAAAKPAAAWSLKHIHRLIVTSATYQQSGRTTSEQLLRDPKNILLARGPRFRVDAEIVRDIALSAAGLLNPEVGGPSIFPPMPKGLFSLSFVDVDFWKTATGPQRYRRSLYVFRRRSIPDPVLASFDAPTGDLSCVRRIRSNTPLAALTGLNATIFSEAAQALALRILREGGATSEQRVQFGFRLCTGRPPSPVERSALIALLTSSRQRMIQGELKAADIAFNEFSKPGDLPASATPNDAAAWMIVARVLLNLDATLSK
jgi:hypothetical protein